MEPATDPSGRERLVLSGAHRGRDRPGNGNFYGDLDMKRIILLAVLALILPKVTMAADSTSDWRVWGQKLRNTRNGEAVLVIAGIPVAASRLGTDTTLRGRYEDHDVSVHCQRRHTYAVQVTCDVYADGDMLKTLRFNAPR